MLRYLKVMKGVFMLEFINVTKQFETVTAVNNISFTLNKRNCFTELLEEMVLVNLQFFV